MHDTVSSMRSKLSNTTSSQLWYNNRNYSGQHARSAPRSGAAHQRTPLSCVHDYERPA